ncbi:M56 family metallopeptidase [Streptosporangiaceae bacterium NEAU-GS5]|nr:M56 family metallopeptidase [Streptosporangiaceae bacterium NEAU-GS5]
MIAVVLAVYAAAGTALLPRLLGWARWRDHAPRLAISLWLAACGSVILAAIFAAIAAAAPSHRIGHGLTGLARAALALLGNRFDPAAIPVRAWFAIGAAGLILAALAQGLGGVLYVTWRERRRHAEMLAVVGRHDHRIGATVLDYGEPMAYCLPGRRPKTVITTAALRSLVPDHVAAVLAHERAHLRGRHHLLLAVAQGLARAFPGLPLFTRAGSEIARLVELRADDVAARRHPRVHIAAAVVSLATGRAPAFALGAGGENALVRVSRMLNPATPLRLREKLIGVAAVAVLLTGPAIIAASPGLMGAVMHHCYTLAFF